VLVLTGPRQVRKTSLLERLFTGHRYVTLDLASNAEMEALLVPYLQNL
jgi:hypothetical protein